MAQLLDGVILMDPTGAILGANDAALRMHGVTRVENLGGTAEGYAERFSLWSAEHRLLKRREYPLFRLLAGEDIPDFVVEVAPAGENEARWVHQVRDVTMDSDGGEPDYLALILNDVSQRFDAEARFNAMFNANPAPAVVVRQRDQRIVRVNSGFRALTEFADGQVIGRTLFGLDLLGSLPDGAAAKEKIEAGEIVAQGEAELLTADGARRLVLFAGQPIDVTDEDSMLLTFADLEPRREAEAALAASEAHLAAVFEMAPVAMTITRDTEHRIARVNAAFRRLTGYGDNEAVGRTADELQLWNSAGERQSMEDDLARDGSVREREGRLLSSGGAPLECLISAETVSVDRKPCVLWAYQDVSERTRSEAELAGAIEGVMRDASSLSRSILDKLAALRRPEAQTNSVTLSPREREILDLICHDLDDSAIAERLRLSRNTVRNHVARLYAKIGVNRRSAAVIWGQERGMGRRGT